MKITVKSMAIFFVFVLVLIGVSTTVFAARRARVIAAPTCEIGSMYGKCSGSYRCGSEVEPNESRQLATSITATNVYGCMMNYQDVDWFKIDCAVGDFPTFILNHDKKVSFNIELYVDGALAATGTAGDGDVILQTKITENTYVRVWPVNGTGYYHLEIVPGNTKFVP